MGVDYSARFGIGLEVSDITVVNFRYMKDVCFDDFLEDLTVASKYRYIKWGGAYDNDIHYAVILKDPFREGFDIDGKVKEFSIWLEANNIDYEDNRIGLVGGLYIS